MSDKREEIIEDVLDSYGHSFQACDYAVRPNDYVARAIVVAIDDKDDCYRIPKAALDGLLAYVDKRIERDSTWTLCTIGDELSDWKEGRFNGWISFGNGKEAGE